MNTRAGIAAAVALALAGQGAILGGAARGGVAALLVGWAWLLILLFRMPAETAREPGPPSAAEWSALAAITAVGAAARLASAGTVPPGLMLDEARMGLLAEAVLRGEDPRPWLHSTEVLGWIPTTIVFAVAGPSIAALRAVPALWGTLTIPVVWWAARPVFGPGAAIAAAGVLALMRWHVEMSRVAFSVVQMPLLVALAAGCLVRARATGWGWKWLAFSGAACGCAVHTYAAGRAVPLVFAALFGAWAISPVGREAGRGMWMILRRWAAGFTGGFVVAGWYLPWHPEWFLARIEEVGRAVPGFAAAGLNMLRGLGAVNVGGCDLVQTFPAPGGSPLVGFAVGAAWVPGLFLLLRAAGRQERVFIAACLAAGFAGAWFEGPHGARMFCLAPLVALGAGVAGLAVVRSVPGRFPVVVAVTLVAAAAGTELWRYGLGPSGGVPAWTADWVFRASELRLAERVCRETGRGPVYMGPDSADPAGMPLEWWAAPVLFASAPCVTRGPIPDPAELRRRRGVVMFVIVGRAYADLVFELLPGGAVVTGSGGEPGMPVATAYMAGPDSFVRARVRTGDLRELLGGFWELDQLIREGRNGDAIVLGDRLAARWPRVGALHAARASALGSAGRMREAEAAARTAISVGARGGVVHLRLGSALLEQRRFSEAIYALERCIREGPDLEDGWAGLVASLANAGRMTEARERLAEARIRFPYSGQLSSLAAQFR